jgi:CubicO group peptidase (beta-lactamase class C family)
VGLRFVAQPDSVESDMQGCRLALSVSVVLFVSHLLACSRKGTPPVSVASASRAAYGGDDLGVALEPIRARLGVPALAVLVVRDDEVIAHGVTGVRAVGDPTRATIDDRWHIGSCTKAMTSTLAALVVAEGKIAWTTTVAEAFAGWTIHPGYRDVTLKMLLSHRGGGPKDFPDDVWRGMTAAGEPAVRRLAAVKELLARAPGAEVGKFTYSNAGYMFAAAALERATGLAFEALLQQRLFAPLHMTSCAFGAPGTNGALDQPRGHRVDATTGKFAAVEPLPDGDLPLSLGPAGTLHCGLRDWARFLVLHARGERGETTLLPTLDRATFDILHTPFPGEPSYALGLAVTEPVWAKGRVFMHEGSNDLWTALQIVVPPRKLVFVGATNAATEAGEGAVEGAFQYVAETYLR